jgi:hypothetical protein
MISLYTRLPKSMTENPINCTRLNNSCPILMKKSQIIIILKDSPTVLRVAEEYLVTAIPKELRQATLITIINDKKIRSVFWPIS